MNEWIDGWMGGGWRVQGRKQTFLYSRMTINKYRRKYGVVKSSLDAKTSG